MAGAVSATEILQPSDPKLIRRKQLLRDCNRLSKAALVFSVEGFSGSLGSKNPYKHLGIFCYEEFVAGMPSDTSKRLSPDGVKHGFQTLARMLRPAPSEYERYCQTTDSAISVDGLRQALLRSGATVQRFLDLPDAVVGDVEARFGMEDDILTYRAGFKFTDSHEGPIYTVDERIFQDALDFAARTNGQPEGPLMPEQYRRCAGRRLIISQIWPAMVNLASDASEVFAHDLGLGNNS